MDTNAENFDFIFNLVDNDVVTYALWYVGSQVCVRVGRRIFRKLKGKVYTKGKVSVRVVDENDLRKPANETPLRSIRNFLSRSITCGSRQSCKFRGDRRRTDNMPEDSELVSEGLVSLFREFNQTWTKFQGLQSKFDTIVDKAQDVKSQISASFCLDVLRLLIDMTNGLKSPQSLISTLVSLYKVYLGSQAIISATQNDPLQKESGVDAFFFSALSMFMPRPFIEILKRLNLFTSAKICDGFHFVFDMMSNVCDFVVLMMQKLGFKDENIKYFKDLFGSFNVGSVHSFISDVVVELEKWKRDKKIICDDLFVNRVNALLAKRDELKELADIRKRSGSIDAVLKALERLEKAILCSTSVSREEPTAFIFEGPPGVFKSVIVNVLVQSMKTTVYAHQVKSTKDGKDFYDTYNNEEIFCVDDMGQQGMSQWRTLINMVSNVKMPLECAAADLKDTKFFSSSSLFITTNRFINLSDPLRDDCIDNIKALHRRGFVFDFNEVTRNGNKLSGAIRFKFFDLGTSRFIVGFPPDVEQFLSKKGIKLDSVLNLKDSDKIEVVSWARNIVKLFKKVREEQKLSNDLTESDLKFIADNDLFTEGDFGESMAGDVCEININRPFNFVYIPTKWEIAKACFKDCLEKLINRVKPTFSEMWNKLEGIFSAVYSGAESLFKWMLDFFNSAPFIVFMGLLSIGSIADTISTYFFSNESAEEEMLAEMISKIKLQEGEVKKSTGIDFVSKHVYKLKIQMRKDYALGVDVDEEDSIVDVCGVVSGHCIVIPAHALSVSNRGFVTIYSNDSKNAILIDHAMFTTKYISPTHDVAIISLPPQMPTPFKNLSKFYKPNEVNGNFTTYNKNNHDLFLIMPKNSIIPLRSMGALPKLCNWYLIDIYSGSEIVNFDNSEDNETQSIEDMSPKSFHYNVGAPGCCGSPLTCANGLILGHHVAGPRPSSSRQDHASIVWPEYIRAKIRDVLALDNKYVVPYDIQDKDFENFSGIKLAVRSNVSTPKQTNIVESPLHGVFPITRTPANLSKFGAHTVKTVEKKSFSPVLDVPIAELDFAEKVLDVMLHNFDDLTEAEIINGSEFLAGINKKSSNGFGCLRAKEDYINFKESSLTVVGKELVDEFERDITQGKIYVEDNLWTSTLKDELRSLSKEGTPRSFRVSPFHVQFLTKKYFGHMVEHLIKTRDFHGIMVGVNPYKDWPAIHDKLLKCSYVWDGDISNYDGNMLPQVQKVVNNVLMRKYFGKHRDAAAFILESLTYCFTALNDDVYMTNHSLPSGSFLTAIYNSLINKAYTAMWYFRNSSIHNRTVNKFFSSVVDFVYGDDKLNGVLSDQMPNLNALTMRDFFISIGMNFTDANKHTVTQRQSDIQSVSFLKRHFVAHNRLRCIVGPLDLNTIYSSLSYLDSTKDLNVVMDGKISAFQRELYLHYDVYHKTMIHFIQFCKDKNFTFTRLPEEYLNALYLQSPEEYVDLWYSSINPI